MILLARMVVTAIFVLAATITAERAGPLVGGLVATLPISAGPVYVFLALDHDAQFIADGAITTLAINAVNVSFALVYARLAQNRSLAVSLSVAFCAWLVLAWTVNIISWTLGSAALLNVVTLPLCLWLARPLRLVTVPPTRARWYELAMRAIMVAILVGVVVGLSDRIGADSSGILAVFPIVLISVMFIMHRRVGGPATAAVLANAILGLVGFAFAAITLHFTTLAFGSPPALLLAISVSIGWGLLVYGARARGIPV
jgi:hypothetical protein